MIVADCVYGEEEINEPVLIDLINSKEVQRLKGISQFGFPPEYSIRKGYSRYEHSIGVLILLKRLKADLKEQIAGLIHDVSHTAFSHVADWVIGDPFKENYQDSIFEEFIKNSNIPPILENYNLNLHNFLDLEKFYLLEQPAPSLCADRFDYTIRQLPKIEDRKFIVPLVFNLNGRMVFTSEKAAEIFSNNYLMLQRDFWGSKDTIGRFHILSNILKYALNKNIISMDSFKEDDSFIINCLLESKDLSIISKLNLLKNGFRAVEDSNGVIMKKKFRYIDPEVLVDGELKRFSEISEDYKKNLEKEREENSRELKIKIMEL